MGDRIANIVKAIDKTLVRSHQKIEDGLFGLHTKFDFHKTILRFEEVKSFYRVEFVHVFGYLDESRTITSDELLELLRGNWGTFRQTSAYLAVGKMEGTDFVSLQAYHLFNKKWEDKDIAEVLSMQISDLLLPFMMAGWPDCIVIETS